MLSIQTASKASGVVFAIALIAIGCGGSSASPVALGAYCDEYAEMICRAAERCDCLAGASVELCQAMTRPDCVDEVDDPVNAGRYTYDASAAGQCLADLERAARDCSTEGDDWPDSCDRVLRGAVPAGQDCTSDDECVSDSECHEDRCTALPRENETCLANSTCAEEHYCGQDDRCHAYPRQGQSCADSYGDCADDLYCSESSQTCQPYPRRGQSCADSYGDCDDDLYCAASSICQAQGGEGAACTDDEHCLSWDCVEGNCAAEEENDICDFF